MVNFDILRLYNITAYIICGMRLLQNPNFVASAQLTQKRVKKHNRAAVTYVIKASCRFMTKFTQNLPNTMIHYLMCTFMGSHNSVSLSVGSFQFSMTKTRISYHTPKSISNIKNWWVVFWCVRHGRWFPQSAVMCCLLITHSFSLCWFTQLKLLWFWRWRSCWRITCRKLASTSSSFWMPALLLLPGPKLCRWVQLPLSHHCQPAQSTGPTGATAADDVCLSL